MLLVVVVVVDFDDWVVYVNVLVEQMLNLLEWLMIGQLFGVILLLFEDVWNCESYGFVVYDIEILIVCGVKICVDFVEMLILDYFGWCVIMLYVLVILCWFGYFVDCVVGVCVVVGVVVMLVYEIKNLLLGICGVVQFLGVGEFIMLIVIEVDCIVVLIDWMQDFSDICLLLIVSENIYLFLIYVCWFVLVGFVCGIMIEEWFDLLLLLLLINCDVLFQIVINFFKNVCEVV